MYSHVRTSLHLFTKFILQSVQPASPIPSGACLEMTKKHAEGTGGVKAADALALSRNQATMAHGMTSLHEGIEYFWGWLTHGTGQWNPLT